VTRDEFLAAVESKFDLDQAEPGDRVLVDAALSTLGEIERLEENLHEGDVTVVSERGNVRANPIFDQLLRHRAALAKLTRELFTTESATTKRARTAARARWARAS
jgi:hypothetical protein